jgi:hypothetical protein
MADRLNSTQIWTRIERAVKNAAVYERGGIACFDTADGTIVPVSNTATLIPIGYFESAGTGDGSTTVGITLLKPVTIAVCKNTGTGNVAAANVGSNCYAYESNGGVTMTASTRSVLGRVYGLVGSGSTATVYVAI